MNPQWHDEFVALCALFASGDLTEEEWALLQVHLAYCESCRSAFQEYQQLARDFIPSIASSVYSDLEFGQQEPRTSLEAAERRLLSQLELSPAESQVSPRRRSMLWLIPGALIAAGVACSIGFYLTHTWRPNAPQFAETRNIAPHGPQVVSSAPAEDDLRNRLRDTQSEVLTLRAQVAAAESRYRQSNSMQASLEQQLATEQDDLKRTENDRMILGQQLAAAEALAQSLRSQSAEVATKTSEQTNQLSSLETRVRDLSASIEEKDRMLALDKELLSHDRDIRDLIGARNLYISDIYDVAQNGKTTKPFGRIFYTKDKSLIFYGYDLDKQPGLRQSVAFQAWGSGDDKQNVSLGLFYQDESHKRWVLRCKDTKTLARLNMVFVTAEPQGGSAKPTGKPLLLAYLQITPNHP